MSAMSDYLENKLIDFLLRQQAFVPPASLYIGLLTGATDDDASPLAEVAGGSYARAQVVSSLANWAGTQGAGTNAVSNGASGGTSNNAEIAFPVPTGDWGQVTHVAIFDAAAAGNMWFYAPLAAPKNVNNGDPAPKFNAGTVALTLDN